MTIALLILIFLSSTNLCAAPTDFTEAFGSQQQIDESTIVKVIKADTVVLENGMRIKLIGVESFGNAPKRYVKYDEKGKMIESPIDPDIPLEEQALYFAQNLLENKRVRLEYDVDTLDDNHERQAYVFDDQDRMANTELLRHGFVRLKIRPPNVKYIHELREAYQEAREEQRGFLSN